MKSKSFIFVLYDGPELAILVDSRYSVQEVVLGDSDMLKNKKTVVDSVQSGLVAAVSYQYSRQCF